MSQWFKNRRQEFIAATIRQFGQIRRADIMRQFEVTAAIASAETEIARLRGIVMRQTIALQAIADPEPHEPADGMVCAIIARKALNQETDQ